MFEDTTKRLQALLDQMDSNSVKERVVIPLGEMIQGKRRREDDIDSSLIFFDLITTLGAIVHAHASFVFLSRSCLALSTRSFTECQAIHAKLMQTDFDSEGKWLLGFKRLIDLYASIPKTA
ncbi:MAG: hypothetical protein BYD32DRAFT_403243 [Podila humilis]|nr:MAG: hypothetical protein BYD32DRAFT_403243 [Podila humilis]